MGIPTITTPRLTLRPFSEQDAEALHRILGIQGILQYFPNPDPPPLERVQRLIAHQLQHWEEHNLGWWAVEPRHQPQLIGWCGLQFLPETDETEVGYLLDKAFWGQGLATEGAQASLRYGFETLELETIIALVLPENIASRRVIEKLGMPFVNEAHYFGIDLYRYVLDRVDFRPQSAPMQVTANHAR
jgi:ribosomal-protein-alanine N-acetyltransferase